MPLIENPGTYRGLPQEWAVNESKNGHPQFVVRFLATEFYDENGAFGEPETWVSWAEYCQEATAYLVLFSDKGPCLNYEQAQKAFGWDGASFAALDSNDWSNCVVQFRIEESTFEGVTRLKVNWIDACDAAPGRTIKKLDAEGLKGLDARFKGQLGPKAAPKSAKPTAPAKPPPAPKPAALEPAADPTPVAEDAPATTPASDAGSSANPPAPKKKGKDKGKGKKAAADKCTKEEAWKIVHKLRTEGVTDSTLADAWLTACAEVAPDEEDDEKFTPEQWAQIRDKTLEQIEHIPF